MKKITVLVATIAMFFAATSKANAATCTWDGTKLTITGSGSETFNGCSDGSNHRNATEVTFAGGITSVGSNAFSYATSLTSVSLGSSVTSIGYNAFYGASALNNVSMPNVTTIGSSAFYNAKSLSSVNMPKVQRIESSAFGYTKSLTELNLPSSLTYVGGDALRTRSNLNIVFSGSLGGWNNDALNDYSEGRTTFNCIGDQDACRAQVDAYMSRATFTNASYVDAYDQDGTQYCYTGQAFGNNKCNYCGDKVSSCHWDDDTGKVVAEGCRNSNYVVGNGQCNYCGDGTPTCHWDDDTGKVVADACYSSGYVFGNGKCNSCGSASSCHWDDDAGKVVADACYSGSTLDEESGICCGWGMDSCHKNSNGQVVADSCAEGLFRRGNYCSSERDCYGYLKKGDECIPASSGCGNGWEAVNDTCVMKIKTRYTIPEATEIAGEIDNTLLIRYK